MRKRVLAGVVVCLTMICAQGVSYAAVSNDEITSVKVKEATSGSTSQDTNSGNGIKTGHIVDTAVISSKIANNAVTGAKIAAGAVANANLADGSVTDAKISGTIIAGKVATYANTFVIHKGAANNINTFNSIMACINYLTNNTGNWTGSRVAITIMPGRYEGEDFSALNYSTIHADIIGASKDGSVIVPVGNSMHVPSGMNLRNVTIEGVYVNIDHTTNAGIYDSKIISSPSETYYAAVEAGWQGISNFTMDNVEIVAWAGAIALNGTIINDTLNFRNIKIVAMTPANSGHITVLYPADPRAIKFSNISFHGQGNVCFNIILNSNTNIYMDNIKVEGVYDSAIAIILGANNVKLNVLNSKLNVPVLMTTDSSSSVETTIDNSYIASLSNIVGSVKVSNSKINGAIPPSNGMLKIVNSFDSNYDPIANGQY